MSLVTILNALQSEDKKERKKALEEIRRNMLEGELSNDNELMQQVLKEILRLFSDKSEACREYAVKLLKEYLKYIPDDDYYLSSVIFTLLQRLGQQEIVEQSEEVRLELILLLRVFVNKFCGSLPKVLNDIIQILIKTLYDPFPAVKRESCECCSEIAKLNPKHFNMQSGSLIKPLLQNFAHQHYRIRLVAIQAVGDVVLHGDIKDMDVIFGSLGERLFDPIITVRRAVADVVGSWLLHLRDRYSYFHRLLPLLLTSMCDDVEEVQLVGRNYWQEAGEKYLKENEDELKDKIDFLTEIPKHYPPHVQRPNLGCRVLVQRNIIKMISSVCLELEDWQVETRVKAAMLFQIMLLNAESNITHHLQKILVGLYHGCKDEDSRVVDNVEKAAEYVGYFVTPKVYLKLILPVLEETSTVAHLRVFSAILRGSECESLVDELSSIMNVLQQHQICWGKELQYQSHLLNCCSVIMNICKERSAVVSQQLFTVLISVRSLAADDYILRKSKALLEQLQTINGFDTSLDLYSTFGETCLKDISSSVEVWTVHSPERYILENIFLNSGEKLNSCMHVITPLLIVVTKPEKDPELRLKIFTMLSSYIVEYGVPLYFGTDSEDILLSLIKDIIIPNLIWKAGRTAEAIRTAAITCFYTTLRKSQTLSVTTLNFIADEALPLLLSAVEDSSRTTRSLACRTLAEFISHMRKTKLLGPPHMHQILGIVIKRFDDVSDDVRLESIRTIRILFSELPPDYDIECSKPIIESMYCSMLLHLDDPQTSFQHVMLEALKDVAHIYPSLLWNKLNESKPSYRSTVNCDDLLDHLRTLNISSCD